MAKARIVAFGEATHGDGAAFEIRDALTRAMHQTLQYSVLALESTGLHQLPDEFDPQIEASNVVDSVESWMWRSSEQARPGLRYAAETVHSSRPLRLKGIDVQHSPAASAALFDDVEEAMRRAGVPLDGWPTVRQTLAQTFQNPFAPVDSSTTAVVASRSREVADDLRLSEPHAAVLLETALAHALVPWTRSMVPRDIQMGRNLVHVAKNVYADEMIIVWAASSHIVTKLPAIDSLDPNWSYDGSISMGDIVADSFGDKYYVVGFTACEGSYGAQSLNLAEQEIEPPLAGSIEALVCSAPFDSAAFVDLRRLASIPAGAWLNSPMLARPLGYTFMRASWPIVLDALIVVREMSPSTPYNP